MCNGPQQRQLLSFGTVKATFSRNCGSSLPQCRLTLKPGHQDWVCTVVSGVGTNPLFLATSTSSNEDETGRMPLLAVDSAAWTCCRLAGFAIALLSVQRQETWVDLKHCLVLPSKVSLRLPDLHS